MILLESAPRELSGGRFKLLVLSVRVLAKGIWLARVLCSGCFIVLGRSYNSMTMNEPPSVRQQVASALKHHTVHGAKRWNNAPILQNVSHSRRTRR